MRPLGCDLGAFRICIFVILYLASGKNKKYDISNGISAALTQERRFLYTLNWHRRLDPELLLDVLTFESRRQYGYEKGFEHERCLFFLPSAHLAH
jgi:hypothetical protein